MGQKSAKNESILAHFGPLFHQLLPHFTQFTSPKPTKMSKKPVQKSDKKKLKNVEKSENLMFQKIKFYVSKNEIF